MLLFLKQLVRYLDLLKLSLSKHMQPFFIPDQLGKLFCILFSPEQSVTRRAIIHIPAFAEEMNKSRRMVRLQSQNFADRGYLVLVLDLFGTGESSGDFSEATWEIWLKNIETAIHWLQDQNIRKIDLWGLRIGALLALDFANRYQNQIEHILCWQPVINGESFINQFLRLRITSALLEIDKKTLQPNTSELKQQILDGQTLEISGYKLNPNLIRPLLSMHADQLEIKSVKEIAIFEIVLNEEQSVSAFTSRLLDNLQKNVSVSFTRVVGSLFWNSVEISDAPLLIKLSNTKLEGWNKDHA